LYRKNDSGSSTNWSEVGSGGSGINYVTNPTASTDTSGWATYADAAGTAPVDGTGGSPTVTWTRSTSSPLRGAADFNFTKDAANRQGQGVATDITIDLADQAKILTVSFDYEVLSGTYATGDLTVYLIADPAGTPVVIQPAGYQVQAATAGTKMRQIATFQTQATGQTYRVCFHVASTSALAYSLAIDNVVVGPQTVQYGAPVTDWVDYTPVWTASVSNPSIGNGTLAGKYRRVGGNHEVAITVILGTTTTIGSGNYFFSTPSSIDTTKLASSDVRGIGTAYVLNSTIAGSIGEVEFASSNTVLIATPAITTTNNTGNALGIIGSSYPGGGTGSTAKANDVYVLRFSYPVLGLSSTVQMSNDTDTRVVAARASGGSSAYGAGGILQYNSVTYDTHGAITTGAGWKFTAPVSGYYRVQLSATRSTSGVQSHVVYVSGVIYQFVMTNVSGTTSYMSGATTVYLNAGQYLDIRTDNAATIEVGVITVERLSGTSAIAATETVAVRATISAGQSIANGAAATVIYNSKAFDTHGAFNASTGVFTVPVSGKYLISAQIRFAAGTWSVGASCALNPFKTGNQFGSVYWDNQNSTFSRIPEAWNTWTIDALAGDTLYVQAVNNLGSLQSLVASASNHIEIFRIGN
jgi:hypothetical protein